MFRNPAGTTTARAIDAAGVKSRRLGGAVVSHRHSNFILNTGGATARDICALIDLVSDRVADHSGLRLEPEVAFVGTAFHRPEADISDCTRKENRSTVHRSGPLLENDVGGHARRGGWSIAASSAPASAAAPTASGV